MFDSETTQGLLSLMVIVLSLALGGLFIYGIGMEIYLRWFQRKEDKDESFNA